MVGVFHGCFRGVLSTAVKHTRADPCYEVDKIYWPVKFGILLDESFSQAIFRCFERSLIESYASKAFQFGRDIRNQYYLPLSKSCVPSVRLFSTPFERTIDSMNSVALGTFTSSFLSLILFKGIFTSNEKELKPHNCSCRIPIDKNTPTSIECCALCTGLDEIPDDIPKISILGSEELEVQRNV